MMPRKPLLLVALVAIGCQTAAIEQQEGCFTTADCPPHTVCNAFEGSCEEEPEQGFVGSFSCVVGEIGSDSALAWSSDIVGQVGDERFVLAGLPQCTNSAFAAGINGGLPELATSFYAADNDIELQVSWGPVSQSEDAVGRVEMKAARAMGTPLPSASFIHWAMGPSADPNLILSEQIDWVESRLLAHSTGGYAYLREPVVQGDLISGFLRIEMAKTKDVLLDWGADCKQGGPSTCGQSYAGRCETGRNGTEFCTMACTADEDCDGGLACLGGLCLLTCAKDADCPQHLACDLSAGIGGCW